MGKLLEWIKELAHVDQSPSRDQADTTLGWDGRCGHCQRWMHRNDLVVRVEVIDTHWVYHCKCGAVVYWNLDMGPVPMADGYRRPDGVMITREQDFTLNPTE